VRYTHHHFSFNDGAEMRQINFNSYANRTSTPYFEDLAFMHLGGIAIPPPRGLGLFAVRNLSLRFTFSGKSFNSKGVQLTIGD